MLDTVAEGFKQAALKLKGKALLTKENVKEATDEIRKSLLDADVEYGVVRQFIGRVEEAALGQVVQTRAGSGAIKAQLGPREHFIGICQTELENLMGPVEPELSYAINKPSMIMMVGLQGTGKTTTSAKLAKFLKDHKRRKPLLVAADIYRPAAIDQLVTLGQRIGIPVFSLPGAKPLAICKAALQKAYDLNCDTLVFDTAGRLTVDQELMHELSEIKDQLKPENILLVCDAMMGQDAVTTAKTFNEKLDLSGFIMTKLDGDARGGAALSIKEVTKKPIKFLGLGEGLDKIEEFRPEGLASRILGKGDVIGLIQDFERVVDKDSEKDALKMLQGQFSFTDFYEQISMIQKMGSLKDLVAKMPMGNMLPAGANLDDKQLTQIKALIDSMTKKERLKPEIINDSRAKRIAKGSGRTVGELKDLVTKFKAMRSMMGSLGKNMGLLGKIPGLGGLQKINNLRQMAQQVQKGGGFPGMPMGGMPGLGDLMGGGGFGSGPKKVVDRDKIKKLRKAAKEARKKNRKK